MKAKHLFLMTFLMLISSCLFAQKKEVNINDFENKPDNSKWWRDNKNVTFSYDEKSSNQVNSQSKVCLYVRWDSIPKSQKSYTWFTDLKADTFVNPIMADLWKYFKQDIWMSFYAKLGDGDTLVLHPLILSKGHKSKWGAKQMTTFSSKKWTLVKVKFADLQYDDWGKIVKPLDLKSDSGKCFEMGLRMSVTAPKGYIEAWFDNVKLTNYEPME